MLSRRELLLTSAGSLILAPGKLLAQAAPANPPKERPAPLAPDLVKEFVTVGHGDFERVKALLTREPTLLNAAWDWGGGDFETALEAAGHVGNRPIAEFLISKGARMNLFCAVMLGQLELVRATLDANPALLESKGPHGLSLIHHAKKGGDGAAKVLAYLESKGAR